MEFLFKGKRVFLQNMDETLSLICIKIELLCLKYLHLKAKGKRLKLSGSKPKTYLEENLFWRFLNLQKFLNLFASPKPNYFDIVPVSWTRSNVSKQPCCLFFSQRLREFLFALSSLSFCFWSFVEATVYLLKHGEIFFWASRRFCVLLLTLHHRNLDVELVSPNTPSKKPKNPQTTNQRYSLPYSHKNILAKSSFVHHCHLGRHCGFTYSTFWPRNQHKTSLWDVGFLRRD